MKIIRYLDASGIEGYAQKTPNGGTVALVGSLPKGFGVTNTPAHVTRILAPIAPLQIIGIGLNYRRHAAEAGAALPKYPVVFQKMLGTVQHPGAPIVLPQVLKSEEVDYECELAVVIGKKCKSVRRENALEYVLGYTCANDVSARDWQLKHGGSQWCRGKSFDTFCPLGPCIVTADEIPNPNRLAIRTLLNDQVVQDWNTDDMIFSVPEIIEFLSGSTTLLPGTVILTGTPHGVGMAAKPPRWLTAGDRVVVEIEKIGQLMNPVENERG
jgi:2-keto-4-pentenoate hydratase/2-oxohepta-3-ene-1,7-dioic acid hydratase in catechol pathway